ncbi:MAG: hypothetical protein AAF718_11620 [Pseudomonadota bacterium]
MRRFTSLLSLAFILTATQAFPADGTVLADASSSKSRAEARHDASGDTVAKSTSAQSKSRRVSRSTAKSENVVTTQNRGKRARRNPTQDALSAPMLAETAEGTDFRTLAANAELLAARIEAGDFSGDLGALALFKLAGKATSDAPLSKAEKAALSTALADKPFTALVQDIEARLVEASGDPNLELDALAAALGVPRPKANEDDIPNLGA